MDARWLRFWVLLLAACPGGDPDAPDGGDAAVEPCTMTASLGTGAAGAAFVPFVDGDVAEVILGYQGFRFMQLILRTEGVGTTRVDAAFTIAVEDAAPYPQWARVDLEEADDGWAYSAPVAIYFNDLPYAQIVGHDCDLSAEVFHPGCSDTVAIHVRLLDEDPCIQGAADVDTNGCSDPDGGTAVDAGAGEGGS